MRGQFLSSVKIAVSENEKSKPRKDSQLCTGYNIQNKKYKHKEKVKWKKKTRVKKASVE